MVQVRAISRNAFLSSSVFALRAQRRHSSAKSRYSLAVDMTLSRPSGMPCDPAPPLAESSLRREPAQNRAGYAFVMGSEPGQIRPLFVPKPATRGANPASTRGGIESGVGRNSHCRIGRFPFGLGVVQRRGESRSRRAAGGAIDSPHIAAALAHAVVLGIKARASVLRACAT
jgi:hypothetical protein